MNISVLKSLLSDLGIMNEIRSVIGDRVICGACQALVRNLQLRATTVEVVGTAVCSLYYSLATLTFSDFCRELVRINKVSCLICAFSKLTTVISNLNLFLANFRIHY